MTFNVGAHGGEDDHMYSGNHQTRRILRELYQNFQENLNVDEVVPLLFQG